MNREQITEALKSLPAYKYAISRYERHITVPSAGIANYSGMQGGSGAPERFFAMVGKAADMGMTSYRDLLDYENYKRIVEDLEGALDVLTDDERIVIKMKWVHDITLRQISNQRNLSIATVERRHKRALSKLTDALRFTKAKVPYIEMHNRCEELSVS
ncbi:sigma factor-like helix-turn-helix DNA-binding protein [Paenibacillus harenae]|uniref:sigma factor-like helix-turn-helix DNA-binding protein n=1 Tax=Paenibacillus harenae TaxID=306543 RepID=UPI00278D9BA7|nr:sigma factor-like helix-turn-helix DNA-binding protein [Paenibacillus harenae]MDQ0062370.1 RNA polymerase sigma factor (sigma-70 family) [Paenibacillus harenae]